MSQRKLENFESKIIPLQPPTANTETTLGKIVGFLFFLFPMVIACVFLWDVFSNLSLAYRCNEVDGYRNRTYIKHVKWFLISYTITYYYTVADIQYTGKDRVSEKPTNIAARVFYDPQDPKISKLETPWKVSLLMGIMMLWLSFSSFRASGDWPGGKSYR